MICDTVKKRGVFEELRADIARAGQAYQRVDEGYLNSLRKAAGVVFLAIFLLTGLLGYHTGFFTLNSVAPLLNHADWQTITFMGDTLFCLTIVLFFARSNPHLVWLAVVAALYGTLYSHGLKHLFAAWRPPALIENELFNLIGASPHRNSFPSGHSLTAFLTASVLAYYYSSQFQRILLFSIASLAAISRVVVGVHWPMDVLAGLLGALISTVLAVYTLSIWRWGLTLRGHLILVSLFFICAIMLLGHDGGYPMASPFAKIVSCSAIIWTLYHYIGKQPCGPA